MYCTTSQSQTWPVGKGGDLQYHRLTGYNVRLVCTLPAACRTPVCQWWDETLFPIFHASWCLKKKKKKKNWGGERSWGGSGVAPERGSGGGQSVSQADRWEKYSRPKVPIGHP